MLLVRSHDQGPTGFSVMQVNAAILSMRRKILSVSRITFTLWSSSFCAAFIISCRWVGLSSAPQYTNSYPKITHVLIKPVTGVKVVGYERSRISLFFTNHLHTVKHEGNLNYNNNMTVTSKKSPPKSDRTFFPCGSALR